MLGNILKYRNVFMAIATVLGLVTATFAATAVDLTPAKAIKYAGQPAHGTWCNYLAVKEANWNDKDGKFTLLPHTKLAGNATVSTNYGEVVTTTVSSNTVSFSTKYGLSGAVYVCITGTSDAPKWGGIGIGAAPTTKAATVDYLGMKDAYWQVNSGYVRVANIFLKEADSTEFTVKGLDKTKVTAMIGKIELGECKATTASADCTFKAPENMTFSELGYGLYVTIKVEYSEATLPDPAVNIGLDVP